VRPASATRRFWLQFRFGATVGLRAISAHPVMLIADPAHSQNTLLRLEHFAELTDRLINHPGTNIEL